ncbi:SPX domain [Geosmithia morbida]|uniref:SPX domain n=1 Tax=Geosmithia morbida TaxID=1094350 RepID=A0A9P5D3A0_9HYPO|nr:SPX domain [Geosmithia morbida]KAF4121580.1 SPX domain [Geosmithia morbida]
MKFARDFKETLASQGFPSHWVENAIPYGQLKKCLKKVQRELQDLGLDPDTLKALSDPKNTSPVALKYRLQTSSDSNLVRPTLTVDVHFRDGIAVDASLTQSTRRFLEKIASELPVSRQSSAPTSPTEEKNESLDATMVDGSAQFNVEEANALKRPGCETIEVPLVFDNQFFEMLQSDVNNIEALQASEEANMTDEIVHIRDQVSVLAKPRKFSKTDLARWRNIFELYLDAEVFFSTHERNCGVRSSSAALEKLSWFQNEVKKRNLAQSFKLPQSHAAFDRFLRLNLSLLKNLQFQELNQTAVMKILKKFDKRTALGISKSFRTAVQPHKLLAGSMAKGVCSQLSQELVSIVPQINDYLCPVCFAIAYQPVRLDCEHLFCISCVINLQRHKDNHCPLCRASVVANASSGNIDTGVAAFMRKYFAKEVKEKERANDIERGIEDFGPGYTPKECIVM